MIFKIHYREISLFWQEEISINLNLLRKTAGYSSVSVRVILTYGLLSRLELKSVAVGTVLGWACMIAFDIYAYRKYGRNFNLI